MMDCINVGMTEGLHVTSLFISSSCFSIFSTFTSRDALDALQKFYLSLFFTMRHWLRRLTPAVSCLHCAPRASRSSPCFSIFSTFTSRDALDALQKFYLSLFFTMRHWLRRLTPAVSCLHCAPQIHYKTFLYEEIRKCS